MEARQKLKYLLAISISLLITMSCQKDDDPLSNLTGFTSFGFKDEIIKSHPFTIDEASFVIKNNDSLPYQFDASSLIAKFSIISGSTVTVGGVAQTSGTSVNNFTNNVTYKVVAEDGIVTKDYNVKLNIAKLNPEAVQWNRKTPEAFDKTFQTQEYFYLNSKHWVIIGKKFRHFGDNPAESKLYSSSDGISWSEETPMGDFPVGFSHNIVVRSNKAYVMGVITPKDKWGMPAPSLESNIFTTEDGITWTKIEEALDESRILSPIFNLRNNIYVFGGNLQSSFGGFNGSRRLGAPFFSPAKISPSTLISTDGVTFTATDYSEEIVKRTLSAGYVYNDKMYVAGGLNLLGHPLSDVWSSTDGIMWTPVSDEGFVPRIKASTVVYDNKVWMFGGQLADGTCTNEVLVSEDGGVVWSPINSDQALPQDFTPRCNADITVDANGIIWIVGGETTIVTTDADGNRDIETEILADIWTGKLNKL